MSHFRFKHFFSRSNSGNKNNCQRLNNGKSEQFEMKSPIAKVVLKRKIPKKKWSSQFVWNVVSFIHHVTFVLKIYEIIFVLIDRLKVRPPALAETNFLANLLPHEHLICASINDSSINCSYAIESFCKYLDVFLLFVIRKEYLFLTKYQTKKCGTFYASFVHDDILRLLFESKWI